MTINDLEAICYGFVSHINITGTIRWSPWDRHANDRIPHEVGCGVIIDDRIYLCKANSVNPSVYAVFTVLSTLFGMKYKILRLVNFIYALYC